MADNSWLSDYTPVDAKAIEPATQAAPVADNSWLSSFTPVDAGQVSAQPPVPAAAADDPRQKFAQDAMARFPTEGEQFAKDQEARGSRGVLGSVSDFFTGADRETARSKNLPELSGLLQNQGTWDNIKTTAALAITPNNDEASQILKSANPNLTFDKDAAGNIIGYDPTTGARALVNSPGASLLDGLQAATGIAAYTPASGAAGLLGAGALRGAAAIGGATALTETGIQTAQAAAGGEFNPEDVAISAIAGAGGELLARGIGAVGGSARTGIADRTAQATQLRGDFDAAVAAGEAPDLAAQRLLGQPAPPPQDTAGAAQSVVTAANASTRQQIPTIERLAADAAPDQRILDAAGRLGVAEKLIPSQYSGSQAYREIEQGLASIPGSQLNVQQKEAYAAVAQQADDLITRYGGTTDKSALSDKFKQQGLSTIEDLEKKSDSLYSQVSAAIPAATQTAPTSTIGYLNSKIAELGDRTLLSAAERRTLSSLSRVDDAGNPIAPTYAALDLIRKEVGSGLRGAGRFKDTESGALRRLYATLSDDQQRTADSMGVGQAFNAAKALVAQRKSVEDGLVQVLGKDLTGALASTFGNSVKQLGAGNFKSFDKVIEQIPQNMRQEAVLTALNDAFTAGSRAEKQMSAPGFVDWYGGLSRNDAARQRLQQYLPIGASQQLDDIYTVAKGMRDASKERITTGRITALLDNFANDGGMLGKLWDVGKKVGAAEGVTSGLGLPGAGTVGVIASTLNKQKTPIAEAAGKLLSSQRFKDTVNAFARSGGTGAANITAQERRLMRTPVYKKWAAALGEESKARVATVGPLVYLSEGASAPAAIELPATTVTP
jgi:hypothetical protein